MDSSLIEKYGITAFESFLSGSELFAPRISSDDKYPSWDGEIILYKTSKHSKDNIEGRIPVQVKSAKRKINKKEKFYIEVSDLNNYLKEGGIILIRPIFRSPSDYNIFIKSLLPLSITKFLENNNKRRKMPVTLERIDSIKAFEERCLFFLKSRQKQYNIDNYIDIESLIPGSNNQTGLIIDAIHDMPIRDSILSDHCFFYQQVDNLCIPVKIQIDRVGFNKPANVFVDDEIFFHEVINSKDVDGNEFIEFNSVIGLKITKKESFKLVTNFNENSLYKDCLQAFRFISSLNTTRTFKIDSILIESVSIEIDDGFQEEYEFFEDLCELFLKFKINYNTLTIKEIRVKQEFLIKLIISFVKNNRIILQNQPEHIIQTLNLYNNHRIIYLRKEEESLYRGYDFFSNDSLPSNFLLKIHLKNTALPCSRFLILNNTHLIKSIDGYFNEVLHDLLSHYSSEVFSNYQLFMLNCISAFDQTDNVEFLKIADKINELITNDVNDMDIYTINKLQIIKRQRLLNQDEKRKLLEIEQKNPEDVNKICCVNILLGYNERFELFYDMLTDKEKDEFKAWPIWGLYQHDLVKI